MKFILLEAVTPEVSEFVASWKEHKNKLEKFFNTVKGVFKNIDSFIDTAKKIDNEHDELTREDIIPQCLQLCKIESEFSQYESKFLQALLELLYPNITKDDLTLELLLTSLKKDGYSLNPDCTEITFKNDFLEDYVDKFDTYANQNLRVATYLFAYLYVNLDDNKISIDNVNEIYDNLKKWFGDASISDARYKLDTYVFLQDTKNKNNYKIPDETTFHSYVDPESQTVYGEDSSKGQQLGTLTAEQLKTWLNRFTKAKKGLNLYDVWVDHEPPVTTYKEAVEQFRDTFNKIDLQKSEKVFEFLKTIRNANWATTLRKVEFKKYPTNSDILDTLVAFIDKQHSSDSDSNSPQAQNSATTQVQAADTQADSASAQAQQTTDVQPQSTDQAQTADEQSSQASPTQEQPADQPDANNTASEDRPLTGLQVIKRLLKIKNTTRTIDPKKVQAYVEELARKNKLLAKFKKIRDWNKLYKLLRAPLKYVKEIRGSDVVALNNKIINYLKKL